MCLQQAIRGAGGCIRGEGKGERRCVYSAGTALCYHFVTGTAAGVGNY